MSSTRESTVSLTSDEEQALFLILKQLGYESMKRLASEEGHPLRAVKRLWYEAEEKARQNAEGTLWYKSLGAQEYQTPTCGPSAQRFLIFYIKNILGGREFTGYHRAVDAMQFFVVHLMVYLFFFRTAPWWVLELRVFACLFLAWVAEDTLWFFMNPFYGPAKYKPEFIPWHASDWWIFMPKGMLMLLVQGAGLYAVTFMPFKKALKFLKPP